MTTSGSSDYNLTAKEIIRSAMRGIGVLQSGESPSHAEMQDGLQTLGLMVKSLQGLGYHLWTYAEATLFLSAGQPDYSLQGARAVSSFRRTTTVEEVSGTTVTVESAEGIENGDNVGFVVGNALTWTTVDGEPVGNVITIADALDIPSGAKVYAYGADDLIVRPLRIRSVRRHNSGTDTPMIEMGRQDYFDQPLKHNKGIPVQFYYDPGRDVGKLYVWPAPQSSADVLHFTYSRPINAFATTNDEPDLPQEWLETLKYQLMVRLASEYGVALRPDVATLAASLLESMVGWDVEPASVYFQPGH